VDCTHRTTKWALKSMRKEEEEEEEEEEELGEKAEKIYFFFCETRICLKQYKMKFPHFR